MKCQDIASRVTKLLVMVGVYSSLVNASCFVSSLPSEKIDALHEALITPGFERALYAVAATTARNHRKDKEKSTLGTLLLS